MFSYFKIVLSTCGSRGTLEVCVTLYTILSAYVYKHPSNIFFFFMDSLLFTTLVPLLSEMVLIIHRRRTIIII